jgi:hypothetical protein
LVVNATASPNNLTQANHQMVPITINVSSPSLCGATLGCRIVSISSNEPEEGLGDGDKSPDWILTGLFSLSVRAERSAHGTGRVYTITIECTDSSGRVTMKEVLVNVPRNN